MDVLSIYSKINVTWADKSFWLFTISKFENESNLLFFQDLIKLKLVDDSDSEEGRRLEATVIEKVNKLSESNPKNEDDYQYCRDSDSDFNNDSDGYESNEVLD